MFRHTVLVAATILSLAGCASPSSDLECSTCKGAAAAKPEPAVIKMDIKVNSYNEIWHDLVSITSLNMYVVNSNQNKGELRATKRTGNDSWEVIDVKVDPQFDDAFDHTVIFKSETHNMTSWAPILAATLKAELER